MDYMVPLTETPLPPRAGLLRHAETCFAIYAENESRLAEKMCWAWLFKWAGWKGE